MNLRISLRWQAAVAVSILVNMAVFGFTSHMGKIAADSPDVEYVAVELMDPDIMTSAAEQTPEKRMEPKPVQLPKPPPVKKMMEPVPPVAPPAEPVVEKELGLSETAPPPVEKETAPLREVVVAPPPVAPAVEPSPQPQGYQPVDRLARKPQFSVRVEPKYPESLRASGMEGKVTVELFLNERGGIDDIQIIKSGGAMFDGAVVRALKASRFEPGYMDGHPVPVRVRIPYLFRLG